MEEDLELTEDVELTDEETIDEGTLLAVDERGGWDIKGNKGG